jgi:hypothetical protein
MDRSPGKCSPAVPRRTFQIAAVSSLQSGLEAPYRSSSCCCNRRILECRTRCNAQTIVGRNPIQSLLDFNRSLPFREPDVLEISRELFGLSAFQGWNWLWVAILLYSPIAASCVSEFARRFEFRCGPEYKHLLHGWIVRTMLRAEANQVVMQQ